MIVHGAPTPQPATLVTPDVHITVAFEGSFRVAGRRETRRRTRGVGRSTVSGLRWLDAGASTGGFTDRLLQGGAAAVVAVDVGYGQLDWGLRNDDRVTVLERTNVRTLDPSDLPWTPDGVVADLSFISLRLVVPALARAVSPEGTMLLDGQTAVRGREGRGAEGRRRQGPCSVDERDRGSGGRGRRAGLGSSSAPRRRDSPGPRATESSSSASREAQRPTEPVSFEP